MDSIIIGPEPIAQRKKTYQNYPKGYYGLSPQIQMCGVQNAIVLYLLLRSNRSLLMLLWRRYFSLFSLWTGALMNTRKEQVKRVVRNRKISCDNTPY